MAKRKAQSKPPTLTDHLRVGESWRLINIAQLEPEIEYIFRHALVQDVTYNSVLRKDRRIIHAAVGGALERLYPDRGDELAATLPLG